MRPSRILLVVILGCAACGSEDGPIRNSDDAAMDALIGPTPPPVGADAAPAPIDGAAASDSGAPQDAGTGVDSSVAPDAGPPLGAIAPAGAGPGGTDALDGDNRFTASSDGAAVWRLDVAEGEHVGFFLQFAAGETGVTMAVLRWDGASAVQLGITDAGPGLRTLAVVERSGPRTHWVVVAAPPSMTGTLSVTRTPYEDGPNCLGDCARLLQFPLPIDSAIDGYAYSSGTVFRYQFGRRDLIMMVRWAGRSLAARGFEPFIPEDFSQWDGQTPGADRGSLRHASHQRGKDVDISLYGSDGTAPWRSYCDAVRTADGRECRAGTVAGFDGAANAAAFESYFATGRVTMCFLDAELIPPVIRGAEDLAAMGMLDPGVLPLYSDGRHLQHWPNHDNHIHIRVSEEPYDGMPITSGFEPFEPP